MRRAFSMRAAMALGVSASLVSGLVPGLTIPASAIGYSDGYKFLEAVRKQDIDAVNKALAKPGNTLVKAVDPSNGDTAMHIVTRARSVPWMNYVAKAGGDVNAKNGRGETPLQIASNLNFVEGVQVLLLRKARPDETNDAGETPLIAAVHTHRLELVRLLIAAGADPDRPDNSGRSARDYAKLDAGGGTALLAELDKAKASKSRSASGKAVYGPSL